MIHPKIVRVEMIELVIFGISSFRAHCTHCGWKGQPRVNEVAAVNDAKRHGASVVDLHPDVRGHA